MIRRATRVSEIDQAFKLEPLKIEELSFYRATAEARDGKESRKRIEKLLRKNPDTTEHILYVAARGCGKSTELNHLQKDIQDDYLVFNYSVLAELDGDNLSYIELFIVTMERLFDFVNTHPEIAVSKAYIQSITRWIRSKEVEEVRDKYLGAEVEAGTETEIGIPFLHKFFAQFKASAKASVSMKATLKETIEPKLSDLIRNCNALIQEIMNSLAEIGKKDILIIIEDLDKISYTAAEELFFNHASHLAQIQANVIYTFPSALRFNLRYNDIRNYFKRDYVLTMIKVHEKDGSDYQPGIDIMREIVEARMDTTLFASPDLLTDLIRRSGGVLRDLFRLIMDAAEMADLDDRDTINADDCLRAINQLRTAYRSMISDLNIGGKHYPVEKYYEILKGLVKNEEKLVDNSDEVMHLRQSLCILDYNGTGWQDVHPVVREILRERNMLS